MSAPTPATPAPGEALRLGSVHHRFPDGFSLDEISLSVSPGELVCLLGPSGCGKSTLLRLVAGLESVQAGRIEIDGRVVAGDGRVRDVAPEHRGVGLMFQDYALFPHLSVIENVCFGLDSGDSDGRRRARARLADMGLAGLADRYPHTLSGGQQQRIALLRALAPDPRVMLLDEPFSGLDEHLRQQVRQETLATLKASGAAALLVTHDPSEAMYLADRLVIMDQGRIVQDAAAVEVYRAPVNAFIAALFGPVNRFLSVVENGHVDTPLGRFSTPDLSSGHRVQVLIRALGVRLVDDPAPGRSPATVISARPLGQTSQVLARLGDGTEVELRVPGIRLPEAGASILLEVDPTEAFAFLI